MAEPQDPKDAKSKPRVVVDIHTHMYPPEYISMLASRTTLPLVRSFPSTGTSPDPDPRLILLDAELPALEKAQRDPTAPAPGRPLTKHFTSLEQKLRFMRTHHIDISVLSLANPWLDFLPPSSAAAVARQINASFEAMCAAHPGKLYFFAALPLTAPQEDVLASIAYIRTALPHCRGVIMGTSGLGGGEGGLDDPRLLPIFAALSSSSSSSSSSSEAEEADHPHNNNNNNAHPLPVFLHPHYGLPNDVFGARAAAGAYGHVLPLALGFPMETTVAVARMYLAGVFDAVPGLRLILAHAGGTLPFLAGRIESCVRHDAALARARGEDGGKGRRRRRTVWEVLREQVYLDAVVYSEVGLRAAVEASGGGREGAERLMFGTDHPFFPPVGEEQGQEEEEEWESVRLNVEAVNRALGEGSEEAALVMGGNAVRVLRLYEEPAKE
ncbi:42093097-d99d-4b69-9c16-cc0406e2d969 [Thermothielavioides terrestris]|uniref:42093097-d99d-4b69-9c16-cc0406e2d969 n=1 Tax=Thermothielavioides terrestris TaxID=2587410 RepID=A0A446BU06_9PEZI|nr:42093097-d99d-4b69-9c16-cc0406e2d969 [Thermothielavioides terrestris]